MSVTDRLAQLIRENEAAYWQRVADDLIDGPRYAAQRTGIEQLAYLTDLQPPAPLPTLDELERLWMEKGKCSELQRKKVRRAWRDFIDATEVESLRDITADVVLAYHD